MNILIVSDFYPPFIGGAERQAQLLAKTFTSRGHAVHVATTWHRGLQENSNEDGVAIHRIKGLFTSVPWFSKQAGRRYHPPFPDPRMALELRRLVNTHKIDIVHSSGWIAYSCAAGLIGSKVPLLISTRDYGYFCAINTFLHKGKVCDGPQLPKCFACAGSTYGYVKAAASVPGVFTFKSLLLSKTSGLHAISSYVLEQIQNYFLPRQTSIKKTIIPSFLESLDSNSVNDEQSSKFLSSLPTEPFILFVGSLQSHKGIYVLLDAYKKLTSPPPLILIGTAWPDSPTKYPSNVVVLSNVPHDHVMLAWEHCLYGVAPSIWPEPLGAVIFEGMSKSKAMIGVRPGGHTDIIVEGETGFLVPAGDRDALQVAMQRLIDEPITREQFGKAGYARAIQFTADASVPKFESFYHDLTQPQADSVAV